MSLQRWFQSTEACYCVHPIQDTQHCEHCLPEHLHPDGSSLCALNCSVSASHTESPSCREMCGLWYLPAAVLQHKHQISLSLVIGRMLWLFELLTSKLRKRKEKNRTNFGLELEQNFQQFLNFCHFELHIYEKWVLNISDYKIKISMNSEQHWRRSSSCSTKH